MPSKITFKYPRLCRRLLRMHAEMLGDAELRGPARQYVSSIQATRMPPKILVEGAFKALLNPFNSFLSR